LKGCGALTAAQTEKINRHREMVLAANQYMNLTAITEAADYDVKHIADCLTVVPYASGQCVDIGSGAGFPGIILAIMRPDCDFTLLDGTGKRARFLQDCIADLGLENCRAIQARAEEYKPRASFDFAVARAVAPMPKLLKWSWPLLKPDGLFVAMKGPGETYPGAEVIELEIAPDMGRTLVMVRKT
jgi:16S rRNA (guanine527-N7)-methyltransferase